MRKLRNRVSGSFLARFDMDWDQGPGGRERSVLTDCKRNTLLWFPRVLHESIALFDIVACSFGLFNFDNYASFRASGVMWGI